MKTNSIYYIVAILFILSCSQKPTHYLEYYPNSNYLKEEAYKLNGRYQGIRKLYFADGTLESIESFNSNGLLDGEAKYYYPSAVVSQIIMFKDSVMNGDYFSFYETGIPKKRLFFFNGKMVGDNYFFNENGVLRAYNFIGFDGIGISSVDFSEGSRLNERYLEVMFIDSTELIENTHGDTTIRSGLLISHLPGTDYKRIQIYDINKKGEEINLEEISSTPKLQFVDRRKKVDCGTLCIKGERYDSVLKKTTFFIIKREL